MEQTFCQSCGMPLSDSSKGTNNDGSYNDDFCAYCYKDGKFTQNFTMSQMIEFCAQFTDQINKESGWNLTPEQAKKADAPVLSTSKTLETKRQKGIERKGC